MSSSDTQPRSGLLAALDAASVESVLEHLPRQQVARGAVLVAEGSAADALYLVETGRFKVERQGVELAMIGAGGAIGEISFFTGQPRTADVTAMRDASVIRLGRAEYDALCRAHPDIPRAIAAELAERLAATSRKVVSDPRCPRARTVAILGAGGIDLPEGFIARLEAALAPHRRHKVITAETFAAAGLGPDPSTPEATAWLNAQETEVETVLFIAGAADCEWGRAALRQADQAVIVGRAGPPPPVSPLEEIAVAMLPAAQRRLVLIHPARAARVSGTADWLDRYDVHLHFHVSLEDAEDIDRLGRFLSDRAIGLVCSGGGAFGAAHVGVFKALREQDIPLDILGGTSVGSAMTAAFALGLPPDEIDRRTDRIFVRSGAMNRITVPKYAFLDHKVLDAALEEHFTSAPIEDLWLPYYAVATDLSANALRIIRRGPLWEAVRASAAIPGALPAFYTRDGDMLVDGGCLDNLPFRAMHALKTGPNIIVNVQKETGNKFHVDYPNLPGRVELLRKSTLPFGKRPPRAPGVVSTVMRSLLVNQADTLKALAPGDLVLRPPILKGAGFLAWDKHRLLYDSAYLHTRDWFAEARSAPDGALKALLDAAGI